MQVPRTACTVGARGRVGVRDRLHACAFPQPDGVHRTVSEQEIRGPFGTAVLVVVQRSAVTSRAQDGRGPTCSVAAPDPPAAPRTVARTTRPAPTSTQPASRGAHPTHLVAAPPREHLRRLLPWCTSRSALGLGHTKPWHRHQPTSSGARRVISTHNAWCSRALSRVICPHNASRVAVT